MIQINHLFIWIGHGCRYDGFPIAWGPVSGASGTPANDEGRDG